MAITKKSRDDTKTTTARRKTASASPKKAGSTTAGNGLRRTDRGVKSVPKKKKAQPKKASKGKAPPARARSKSAGTAGVKSPRRALGTKSASRGAVSGAAVRLARPPQALAVGDLVEIIKSGAIWNGTTGSVAGFTTKDGVAMAIVSYEISNGVMGSKPFPLDRLKKIPSSNTVVNPRS
jgi:hypothetical protein